MDVASFLGSTNLLLLVVNVIVIYLLGFKWKNLAE